MPQLRSSKLGLIKNSPAKNVLRVPNTDDHLTEENFKREFEKIVCDISSADIKSCLQSSKSEAQFYGEICNEELRKLRQEKDELDEKVRIETETNKKKDAEAAKIVKKLWEEANRVPSKGKRLLSVALKKRCLKPEDVKKVWQEAKKLSNQAKQKHRKLIAQRNELDAKIQLAKKAIQFCSKFGHVSLNN